MTRNNKQIQKRKKNKKNHRSSLIIKSFVHTYLTLLDFIFISCLLLDLTCQVTIVTSIKLELYKVIAKNYKTSVVAWCKGIH